MPEPTRDDQPSAPVGPTPANVPLDEPTSLPFASGSASQPDDSQALDLAGSAVDADGSPQHPAHGLDVSQPVHLAATVEFLAQQAQQVKVERRQEIAATLMIELAMGLLFAVGAGFALAHWQNSLDDDRQEAALEADQRTAERAEVLGNVAYIRNALANGGSRDFRHMNLRGANLSGFDLGCDVEVQHGQQAEPGNEADLGETPRVNIVAVDVATCADLSGADLTGAVLQGTDLTGARLDAVQFAPTSTAGARLAGAWVHGQFDVEFRNADLRGAQFLYKHERGSAAPRITVRDSRMDALSVGASNHTPSDMYEPFSVIRSEALQTHWAPGTAACSGEYHIDEEESICIGAEKHDETHFPLDEQEKFYDALGCTLTRERDTLVTTCYPFESQLDE
jgi:hypothetical protein